MKKTLKKLSRQRKKPCFPEEIDQAFDKKRTPSWSHQKVHILTYSKSYIEAQ